MMAQLEAIPILNVCLSMHQLGIAYPNNKLPQCVVGAEGGVSIIAASACYARSASASAGTRAKSLVLPELAIEHLGDAADCRHRRLLPAPGSLSAVDRITLQWN
jgi:hypothetical protein